MAYAVKADLQKRLDDAKLLQLTDFANAGSVDDTRITEALNAASSLVDSYTGGRYVLPLTVSDQVKDITLDIAIYKLHSGRQIDSDPVKEAYDQALRFLKDVSAGKASLNQSGKVQSTERDVKTRDHDADPEVFDDTKLRDF